MTSKLNVNSITTTTPPDHPSPPPSRSSSATTFAGHHIRLMCSFGGRILPRPHDHQLRYVGGDTRIVAVPRSASFSTLLSKLSKITTFSVPADQLTIKYQLPNEDLESLISLTSDEDVDNMMDEYDRLLFVHRTPRLRLFLFHSAADSSAAFGSIFSGSSGSKWFLDALNGSNAMPPSILEHSRSEVSSIVSEIPDYLFGFDNNSDETPPPAAMRTSLADMDDLAVCERAITNVDDIPAESPVHLHRQNSFVPNPAWHPMPVYYVGGPMMPGGTAPVQMPFPVVGHQVRGGQAAFGYAGPVQAVVGNPIHGGPVYVGGTHMVGPAYDYEIVANGELMRTSTGVTPAAAELAYQVV